LTSKERDAVALSITEAENVALSIAAQSAVRCRQLLQNVVHHHHRGPTTVYEDNEGAVKVANNPMTSHKSKHIDIRHHYTRELVDARTIAVISVPTSSPMD
jgi:hypothetical protein